MEEEKIESPYIDKPSYDYNALRDTTSVEAMKAIWKMFGENADDLIYTTKTDIKDIHENHENISQKIVEILVQHKVVNKDLQWLVEQMQTVIYSVFEILSRRKKETEKEYLSRIMEVRDPGSNKYSHDYATLGDLFTKLQEIREKHGDNGADYFFIEKK